MTSNNNMDMDDQIAYLLGAMSLDGRALSGGNFGNEKSLQTYKAHDAVMSDGSDSEDSTYSPSPSVSSKANADVEASSQTYPPSPYPPFQAPSACSLLQYTQRQLQTGRFSTTGGDYLETIFTHREAFYAYPQGHQGCAIGFSDLASLLEAREWRADRDSDSEAAAAFKHEAVMIAHS
ncbi:unnamed protein product [Somion occarium]|uniref:Uncharacterized protein n=1 Tax=Somion occarium TaxID=3059160 RepID=A0ABP1DVY8_9APHY